jgi:multidrug efflux pump subunit AcrA (membrane-fusion protein)
MIGVRTGVVEKGEVEHFIRTVGRVAPDEKRVYRLVAGTDGWIRETYNNDTGTLVKKDERLASFYTPQFRAAQLAYLSILGAPDDQRFQAGGRQALAPSQQASISLQTYVDALESLGMSEHQMKELASTKQVTDKVFIMAPATGFVLARNVSPGQRFEKGFEWYRVADLSRVWILADLFPIEAADPKPGMKARVTLPDQKKEFHATVAKVLPQFDPNSRTLKVRLELDNPGFVLRPDMFVDVEFPVALPSTLTVPAEIHDRGHNLSRARSHIVVHRDRVRCDEEDRSSHGWGYLYFLLAGAAGVSGDLPDLEMELRVEEADLIVKEFLCYDLV